ncbi:metal ABC transporter permease [Arsenophonus endosymbiont of Aleurodicus floccissimus]|uniref:metal ABC transporter permease n=1 Tax=Arsenophonus endosymbiont of Aleurodicus floccissimus TaxID=2152761 RepID=UPI0034E1EF06
MSPGIIAFTLCQNFSRMLVIAVIASIISSLIDTILSFHIDAATGPCIVITQAIYFIAALIYNYISKIKKRSSFDKISIHSP